MFVVDRDTEGELRERLTRVETKIDILLAKIGGTVEELEQRVRHVEGKWVYATGFLAAVVTGWSALAEFVLK